MTVTMTKSRKSLYRIITVGLMAALVYAGNYLQIKIPAGMFITRIHLGNSMCLLAGLLFGSLGGGLSSGIGAAMFDLFDPTFIVYAPYTFFSKFAMGFTAGALRKANEPLRVTAAAIAGQIVYIALYLLEGYYEVIFLGGAKETAFASMGTKAAASSVNAVVSVLIAVPLYFALRNALRRTGIYPLIAGNDKEEHKNGK